MGISVGVFVSLDNMFCWSCFMIYFEPYLMYIAYWLNVGHAEYDVVSQRLKKIIKKIIKKIEKEKEKQ